MHKFCPNCGHNLQELLPRVQHATLPGNRKRRFEYSNWAGSNKFWEIWRHDNTVYTQYGRIGTTGTRIQKRFTGPAGAYLYLNQKINEKKRDGYWEVEVL